MSRLGIAQIHLALRSLLQGFLILKKYETPSIRTGYHDAADEHDGTAENKSKAGSKESVCVHQRQFHQVPQDQGLPYAQDLQRRGEARDSGTGPQDETHPVRRVLQTHEEKG